MRAPTLDRARLHVRALSVYTADHMAASDFCVCDGIIQASFRIVITTPLISLKCILLVCITFEWL